MIRFSDLGSIVGRKVGQNCGEKLEAITQLIEKLLDDDQAIVFAPNEEIINILEGVFEHYKISCQSLNRGTRATSAKIIEHFKTDKNANTKKRLIVMNLGSESAAGVWVPLSFEPSYSY